MYNRVHNVLPWSKSQNHRLTGKSNWTKWQSSGDCVVTGKILLKNCGHQFYILGQIELLYRSANLNILHITAKKDIGYLE